LGRVRAVAGTFSGTFFLGPTASQPGKLMNPERRSFSTAPWRRTQRQHVRVNSRPASPTEWWPRGLTEKLALLVGFWLWSTAEVTMW